jgi:hypothetical protein
MAINAAGKRLNKAEEKLGWDASLAPTLPDTTKSPVL